MTATFVCFHGPHCRDGFGAAFAAWLAIGDGTLDGKEVLRGRVINNLSPEEQSRWAPVTYVSMAYGDPMPEIPDGSTVYFLDYSRPADETMALAARCSVFVLDHHKTAQADLESIMDVRLSHFDNPFVVFDMNKSGAVLAWEHFHPGKPVPELLLYVQDRDLWRNELPHTQEINARLSSMPMDFAVWRELNEAWSYAGGGVENDLIYAGKAVLDQIKADVELVAKNAAVDNLGPHVVVAVNCPLRQSDLLDHLLPLYPQCAFALSYWRLADGRWQYSLRSRGDFDVSAVAKNYGGGGHKNAAGFTVADLSEVGIL